MIALPALPVVEVLDSLTEALERVGAAVLVAPPGAGKTTLVPLRLLDAPFARDKRILLVEPRRIAARAAATRMAEILGERVGETVGWRMRLDTRVSAATKIEVVTEGVFTRLVLGDPELAGIGAVIFDEFHERSLDADFGLALALDLRGALREDLRVLAMSATLDGARVAALLGDAPVIRSVGRAYAVTVRYREPPAGEGVEDTVAAAVRDVLASETGSILAFLPGQREIIRTAERLEGRLPPNVVLAPLFGAMDAAAQDRAIRPAPPGARKVVLATNVAETSITVDGVTAVIDAGLRRRPAFEPSTGLTRLETVRVSRAGAEQRAGRAGRTAPGVAIRLWRAEQTAALDAFDRPEILESDLSGLVLDCAAWGLADPRRLAFLDPPPEPALREAKALLTELGALDAGGRPTVLGLAMRELPLPPRLARMVAGSAAGAGRRLAAEFAVLLTERGLGGVAVDLAERLGRWRTERSPRARDAARLAARIAAAPDLPRHGSDDEEPGALLALAYPDRAALPRGGRGRFVLANGRGGALDEADPLAGAPALVVAELGGEAREARILSATSLSRETLERVLAERLSEEDVVTFDPGSRAVRARRVRRLGRAILNETPLPDAPFDAVGRALADGIRALGLAALPFDNEGERLLGRLRFLGAQLGTPWPDLSDAALLGTLDEWLMPFLPGVSRLADIGPGPLRAALAGLAPPDMRDRLDALAPTHFEAPTGSRLPIRYEAEGPVLAVRVQELFGLTRHPAIAGGRLPLTLELLSPAGRPIQITRDLPGFWAGSWRDVRASLRGRYPRHAWPEDPAAAMPTARAKPRAP